jgi:hypothetical protein
LFDGDVLPRTPFEALAAGAGREVELIAGHNLDEYRLFLATDGRLGNITDQEAATALRILAPDADGAKGDRQAYPDASTERLYELVNSDWLFRMPSHRLTEAQVAGGGRAYAYELIWPAPGMDGVLGACHSLDVPLVFGNSRRGLLDLLLGAEPPLTPSWSRGTSAPRGRPSPAPATQAGRPTTHSNVWSRSSTPRSELRRTRGGVAPSVGRPRMRTPTLQDA